MKEKETLTFSLRNSDDDDDDDCWNFFNFETLIFDCSFNDCRIRFIRCGLPRRPVATLIASSNVVRKCKKIR